MQCGECMTGCRHNAKNTLPKNYLGLAERNGAVVYPLTTVTTPRPLAGGGTASTPSAQGHPRTGQADLHRRSGRGAAGTYNTQKLLHRMKDSGHLHRLSPALGRLSRSNSESILGRCPTTAPTTSPAAWRSPRRSTRIPTPTSSPCGTAKGSNSMGLLATIMTDEEEGVPRWKTWAKAAVTKPGDMVKVFTHLRGWSERNVIMLVMQPLDNSLTVFTKKGLFGRRKLTSKQGEGAPNPTWIPAGNEVTDAPPS